MRFRKGDYIKGRMAPFNQIVLGIYLRPAVNIPANVIIRYSSPSGTATVSVSKPQKLGIKAYRYELKVMQPRREAACRRRAEKMWRP